MIGLTADINVMAVLVAAVVNVMIGMVWYSPAFLGNMWMDLSGMKPKNKTEEAQMKKDAMPAMVGSAVVSLIMAYVLAHFVDFLNVQTISQGAQLGFWVWLGFVGTVTLSDHLYTKNPIQLYFINTGYRLVSFLAMGAVLAAI